MHHKTVAQLSKALHKKEFSSVELTQHYLDRIQRLDPTLNSYITVTPDRALNDAKKADQRRHTAQATPLTGIPIAHKDIFCTQGIKTTCASRMLSNFIAPYSATVVTRFDAAGMVLLGKTNLDEFAMGSSNEHSAYGTVKSPWDLTRTPGGSSGGSSAAVAAGLSPTATATDTGGSIRQPAALCGITGLKPTYGRVSRYGMIAYASSLDQCGVMAKTAEDCALLLQAIAGLDPHDGTSSDQTVPDYQAYLNTPLKGLKIGVPDEFFKEGLDPAVAEVVHQALKVYVTLGATLKAVTLPHTHLALPVYYAVSAAECSSNLSRFDGVRFGYRAQAPTDLNDLYERTRGEGFGPEVKRRILIGTYVLSAGYYDAYYVKAQKIRHLVQQDYLSAFETVDVIMGPVTPTPAFKLGEKADPLSMYLADVYTLPVNLAGLPGLSIPAGFVGGLPVGLQLIGPAFSEAALLSIAHHFQQETDWHQKVPSENGFTNLKSIP